MEGHLKISLRAARVNAGMKQADAAREIGICWTTLKRYEAGTSVPRADVLEKMGRVYGIPVNYLGYGPSGGERR